MQTINIVRIEQSRQGTYGRLFMGDDFYCFTMEPPWRNNLPNRSCIPENVYRCLWHRSPRYGWVYRLVDVADRAHILIHSGNYGGDPELGYKTHTKGCILLGRRIGRLGKQRAVLISRSTVRHFNALMQKNAFMLTIF